MLATLMTIAFAAAAVLALAVIAASLAKGFGAAASLRRQIALCSDERGDGKARTNPRPLLRGARFQSGARVAAEDSPPCSLAGRAAAARCRLIFA